MQSGVLAESVERLLSTASSVSVERDEVTVAIEPGAAHAALKSLRDSAEHRFDQLIDLCGVDYAAFGTESDAPDCAHDGSPRLAVVYHLQSVEHNHRIRVKVDLDQDHPKTDSVVDIWPVANWFEREAFDMYGMVFEGHPDLRRLLTDYGFIGHPFRKDFPISGHVEMRYDADKGRVVYEPVSIEPRVLVPKVIREDGYGG